MIAPSPKLLDLAAALRPALGLDGGGTVSADLAKFAITRHRVGPLLHHAVTKGSSKAEAGAMEKLANAAAGNVRRTLRNQGAMARIATLFDEHGIPFAEFKGGTLAEQLYQDRKLRHCKDVDILVDRDRIGEAIELVASKGYVRPDGQGIDPKRSRLALRFEKEVEVCDPHLGALIELHASLLTYMPPGWDDRQFLRTTPDLGDAHYVLYLILHGGTTRWHRLKWLADLAMLVRRVDIATRDATIALIRRYRCEALVAASLHILESLWSLPETPAWLDAIERFAPEKRVSEQIESFTAAITKTGGRLQRESLLRRLEIRRAAPVFGDKGPSRFEVLRNRVGYWYCQRF